MASRKVFMVKQTQGERAFWNDTEMAAYFAAKPADPRVIDFVNEQYPEPAGLAALDLGCGGGRHSELLASRGFDVVSVDPNPGMRDATRKRLASKGLTAAVLEGEILSIPLADNSADLVVTTGVLHQANTSHEYELALDELSRVMKRGAYVCLNVFTNSAWDDSYRVVSDDSLSVMTAEDLPMTLWPRQRLVDELSRRDIQLVSDYPEDIRQENTGERAVYRGNFQRV